MAGAEVRHLRLVDRRLLDGEVDEAASAEDARVEVEVARLLVDVLEDEALEAVFLQPLVLITKRADPVRMLMRFMTVVVMIQTCGAFSMSAVLVRSARVCESCR